MFTFLRRLSKNKTITLVSNKYSQIVVNIITLLSILRYKITTDITHNIIL